jgi:predicted transcriptional regulator with HTH domain
MGSGQRFGLRWNGRLSIVELGLMEFEQKATEGTKDSGSD